MLRRALCDVIEREGLADVMASQLAYKAAEGDLRALGMVIQVLGEDGPLVDHIRVDWGPGMQELSE